MAQDITINSLDPNTFEYQTYSDADSQLIIQSKLDTIFNPNTDYIEYYVYDQNQTLIYPSSTIPLLNYDVREGDVILSPQDNLISSGYDLGVFNILYNFYRKRLSSNISEKYFITNISSDRTEVRLDSNVIPNELIISSSNSFTQYREEADYFVDFYLNFGLNQTVIANNIKLETEQGIDPTILIKLYEPLPSNFNLKDELWIVEELSSPQAYEVNFPFEPVIEDDFTYISGPNYNLNITQQTSTGGESFSISTLLQSDVTSSVNQIQNLLNKKEIDININYEKYSNFIHFSSAKTRLENFIHKTGLIESASNQLSSVLGRVTGNTINTIAYSSSKAILSSQIDNIITNFDGYESFLYFNSGSKYSYPKQNTTPPFKLYPTSSIETLNWVGSANLENPYYGGQALSASNYDQDNKNWLYWSIPEYLREDPANRGYELFTDMVAQYYDNVWTYTKDISNKFDADNRLEYGISKDLVADAIRDFGVKLYSSNFNTNDLFTAFLGLTPSGSAFPFPEMTGSVVDGSGDLAIPSGYEYVDTEISASNDIVPLNDVQKQVYKRIYHNIPYLLKTKGTVAGIRALITSYGIPDTILRISEFGGKDRNESQDYDLKQDVFNYAFDTGASATNFVSSSLQANTKFPVQSGTSGPNKARTIQLRFKSPTLPLPVNNVASSNIRPLQSLWSTDEPSGNLVLEYNGAGLISGSYSGSIPDPYDTYGTLKWIPAEENDPNLSASVYLPFFNGDWWSVQMNVNDVTASLYAANEIDGKIGFNESSSTVGFDDSFYYESTIGYLNKDTNVVFDDGTTYTPFSGSFQELRYYVNEISQSRFYDYTVNPYSNEGNGINSTPDQQFFRAALGTQLDTGSRTSIHPRVTGSAVQITQSFATDSEFYINSSRFITNVEDIFQDQVPAGMKNRITNKIQTENLILAEAPYGFQTPTSSEATISSPTSDVISPMESIQQQSFISQSYTPNVNYLEVGFSPSNQINDDINAQLGYFNIGDYIGDPRQNFSSSLSYPNLNRLRDSYFEKYIRGYDVVDFVRLIKFFDNSLFKMIEDFTPARTSLASGVIVKQHLLERNRQRPALVTSSLHVYEGLVVNLPKDYSSGSTDFPQYSTEGSALYTFTGGTGGSFERFNGLQTYPSGSKGLGPDNRFFLTQSWDDSLDYSIINSLNFNQSNSFYISASGGEGKFPGTGRWIKDNQSEFYDGIFSGSKINVTNGDLNPGCESYLNVSDTPIIYNPIFFSFNPTIQGTVSPSAFLDNRNNPVPGDAWIASNTINGQSVVQWIKLARYDVNNNEVGEYIVGSEKLEIIFQEGAKEYYIDGVTVGAKSTILNINESTGDTDFIWSEDGGSENFSLIASGSFTESYNGEDNQSQGSFIANDREIQNQVFWFWGDQNGNTANYNTSNDTLGFFNPGSPLINYQDILQFPSANYISGSYTLGRTPNIPLYFSCSIAYSASDLGTSATIITENIYHSASNISPNVEDQTITFTAQSTDPANDVTSGVYRPSSGQGFTTLNANPVFFRDFANTNQGGAIDDPLTTAGTGHATMTNKMTSSFQWNTPTLEFQAWSTQQPSQIGAWFPISSSDYTAGTENTTGEFGFYSLGFGNGALDVDEVGTYSITGNYVISELNATLGLGVTADEIQNCSIDVGMTVEAPTGTDVTFSIAYVGSSLSNGVTYTPSNPGFGLSLAEPPFTNFIGYPAVGGTPGATPYDDGYWIEDATDPGIWKLGGFSSAGNVDNVLYQMNMAPFGSNGNRLASGIINPNNGATLSIGPTSTGPGTISNVSFSSVTGGSAQGGNGGTVSITTDGTNATAVQRIFAGQGYMVDNTLTITEADLQAVGFASAVGDLIIGPLTNANLTPTGQSNATSYFQPIAYSPSIPRTTPITGVSITNLAVYLDAESLSYNSTTGGGTTGQSQTVSKYVVGGINSGINSVTDFTLYPSNNYLSSQFFPSFDLQTFLKVTGSIPGESNPARTIAYSPIFNVALSESFGVNSEEPYIVRIPFGASQTVPYGASGGELLGYFEVPENNVEYNASDPATTSSTQTQADDMFFIEYSMSNYINPAYEYTAGAGQSQILFDPTTPSDLSIPNPSMTSSFLKITSSVNQVVGDETLTGSIYVQNTTLDTQNTNFIINPESAADENKIFINSSTAVGRITVTGSTFGNFTSLDSIRMGLSVSKSFGIGLTITEYSMSIFPSSSTEWAPFNNTLKMSDGIIAPVTFSRYRVPSNAAALVPTFFGNNVIPFNLALDCQPLLNNFVNQRFNPHIMDIDYNLQATNTASYFFGGDFYTPGQGNTAAPVNLRQIISGSALRATVPESNYTIARSIRPRYEGSKSTSQELNVWNIGDVGTFGKLPTIELRDAYFGYFNDLDDPYPNINGLTRVNLNYLIDEQGNALPPSLEQLSIDTFKAVFPNTTLGKLAAKSGNGQYRSLGAPAAIERTMQYVTPIIYSQNSANNYAPVLPLSGSGFISQYDNGDENDALFARFSAQGSASIDTSVPLQTVDYYLDPSEFLTGSAQNDRGRDSGGAVQGDVLNPWNVDVLGGGAVAVQFPQNAFISALYPVNVKTGQANTGIIPTIVEGVDLASSQIVSVQTSFVTSFVSETNRTREELKFEVHMYSSGSRNNNIWVGKEEKPFNLEDITCKVYTDDGRVTNIGSVLDYGWFQIGNINNYYTVRRRNNLAGFLRRWRFKRWKYTRVPVPTGGIRCFAEWEMFETLFDLGLMRERKSKSGAGVVALEWIITANSGKYIIQGGDAINWRINGSFKNAAGGYRQGYFFPIGYAGSYTSVNMQGQGANDYLMGEANTAKAPYWVYTGSAGTGTNILDQSILVMSSSNLNEAYGTAFRQGDLEYFPGQSEYFPGGVEPANTAFDRIDSTIQLQEGDEIRFANNESYTYTIDEVFAPAENLEGVTGNKKPRLKIKLNGDVPKSINKDFFLVRRPVVNPNSLYLDSPFPYENLASASISFVTKNTGSFPNAGPDGSFGISSSAMLNGVDAEGNYTASLSNLEIASTPGILYPDFPTEYLVKSASVIVNDLISKGIIES